MGATRHVRGSALKVVCITALEAAVIIAVLHAWVIVQGDVMHLAQEVVREVVRDRQKAIAAHVKENV